MKLLFKCKSLLLICVILQACSTARKTDIDKVEDEKVSSITTEQTKKKGIVLIDDDLEVDTEKELEERKAYLEEARSQDSGD